MAELQAFLQEAKVDPKVIGHITKALPHKSVADFAKGWTSANFEQGMQNDIVAKTGLSGMEAKLQVSRLRAAWKAASSKTGSGGKEFPSIKFTYFTVEGGGECIRLAFALGGVPYIDDRIDMATQWKDMKPTTPFGQLPVMTVDGSKQIAQSQGMLRLACKLAGLIPEDPVEFLKAEEVVGLSWDMVDAITPSMQLDRRPYLYGCEGLPLEQLTKKAVEMREKLSAPDGEINRFLGYLDGLLAKNGTGWFVGNKPSLAECEMIPRLRSLRKGNRDGFPKTIVDKHKNLMKMYWAFHELPAIKAHYKGVPPY
uniref:Glutathione-S-transferase n=1 Tax=Pyrocystis lunula TaxID=2972 RepID=Q7XYY5_PYRLU|nr:glutathione-S-transferase [Pyrocystis lunula]